MSSETGMNENGAVQRIPSDYSDQSLIRERDSHRLGETDLAQTRAFDFAGEHGHAVRRMGCRRN